MITKTAVDLFDQWALSGKDKGMEEGHSISVKRMIEIATNKLSKTNNQFSILDIGCGVGVTTKKLLELGYNVDGLVPYQWMAEYASNLLLNLKKDNTGRIYECRFEDFRFNEADKSKFETAWKYNTDIQDNLGDDFKFNDAASATR